MEGWTELLTKSDCLLWGSLAMTLFTLVLPHVPLPAPIPVPSCSPSSTLLYLSLLFPFPTLSSFKLGLFLSPYLSLSLKPQKNHDLSSRTAKKRNEVFSSQSEVNNRIERERKRARKRDRQRNGD